jgi:hypothetical protein
MVPFIHITYRELDRNQSADFIRLYYGKLSRKSNKEDVVLMSKSEFDKLQKMIEDNKVEIDKFQKLIEDNKVEMAELVEAVKEIKSTAK